MKDNLFKSLRGVTISALTKLLLSFNVWGEIEIIWQKDKVVASRPPAAKCPRQHTKHFRWTLNSGRGLTPPIQCDEDYALPLGGPATHMAARPKNMAYRPMTLRRTHK